jgi:ABC-type lipoprotein release transport system permease subunit
VIVRTAIRALRGSPAFSLVVVMTMAVAFAIVAALACLGPSLRASRIDPLVAFRSDT